MKTQEQVLIERHVVDQIMDYELTGVVFVLSVLVVIGEP